MKGRPGVLVARLCFAALLWWLYAGDVTRWVRAQNAEVAVMNALPSLPLALLGVLVALAFTFVTLAPVVDPKMKRTATSAALLLVAIDLLVISPRRSLLLPEETLFAALNTVVEAGNGASGTMVVARDPAVFDEALAPHTDVPLFVRGERVPKWKVQLREGCAGPATSLDGATPGTLVYCVASDRQQAWVTVVATANARTFGEAAMAGTEGGWVGLVTVARDDEPAAASPVWEAPTPE